MTNDLVMNQHWINILILIIKLILVKHFLSLVTKERREKTNL